MPRWYVGIRPGSSPRIVPTHGSSEEEDAQELSKLFVDLGWDPKDLVVVKVEEKDKEPN